MVATPWPGPWMHLKPRARCLAAPKEPARSSKQAACVLSRISREWSSRARADRQRQLLSSNEPCGTDDPLDLQKLKESFDVFCFDQTSELFRQIVRLNRRAISDAALRIAIRYGGTAALRFPIRLNPT